MFFGKPKAVVYLHRNGFQFYPKEAPEGIAYQFPAEAVKDLDVINSEELNSSVKSFVQKNNLKPGNIIIVLSEEIIFTTDIAIADPTQETKIQDFLAEVPFEHIGKTIVRFKEKTTIFATNKDLYQQIKNSFEQLGWLVEAVVPISIFGNIGANNRLNSQEISKIVKSNNIIKAGNLLVKKETAKIKGGSDKKWRFLASKKRQIIFSAAFSFTAISVLLISVLATLKKRSSPVPEAAIPPSVIPTLQPTVTPTLEPTPEVSRNQLKINVLNGTGIPGQAAKVRSLLVELGYSDIEIGNATGATGVETISVFAETVPDVFRQEILQALGQSFDKVASQEGQVTPAYDIVVTTGRVK